MKKKVDSRIRTLIENGVKLRHRSMFIIVGDKGKDQIVNLHYMLSKASIKPRPSALWCYKKELGFSSHAKKRAKQTKNEVKRGLREADAEDPFELFVTSTNIRYCYYKETHKILGNTYGMCVLQDFEALTPNLLARTIETVEGGGLVILLLKTLDSLQQLYTMTMDVHARFRTESQQDVVGRFNERFLLSLAGCAESLVVDDELNILPLSSHVRNIQPVVVPTIITEDGEEKTSDVIISPSAQELSKLQLDMASTMPIGALLQTCKTLDQAKAVLTFVDAIAEKTLRNTVTMTAARGRGKSAALGLAIAAAVAYGYANIFVTAPSPENLNTLFQMVFAGFDALEYKEHADYEIVQSLNPELNKAVVRVNITRSHRQTIQYISPEDANRLAQAELLVIDEAAAIPLPLVKKLMGPYLVFMSSTVNGYEGTGRSLSLKLIKELRQASVSGPNQANQGQGGRALREIELKEPIRYGEGDGIEKWLTQLLCLDCVGETHRITSATPHPSQCELYHVNRDTLFSFHKASEMFLQRMMSLYVSSHYKNTPNDLQLLSDAPAHHLFVLLGPLREDVVVPDILCVIQVCLEGEISKESVMAGLARGERAAGDLIPWTMTSQFQDSDFPSLSGARVVRIATHPDLNRMGYASRALSILSAYYEGQITNLSEVDAETKDSEEEEEEVKQPAHSGGSLLTEKLKPRKNLKPLLENLSDRKPESLHWIGTSYGLTQGLFNFWKKNNFVPVYLRQTTNDLTGEHTCIMLRALEGNALNLVGNSDWLSGFSADFRRRFISLLGYNFSTFDSVLALSVLDPHPALISTSKDAFDKENVKNDSEITYEEVGQILTEFDLRRLESYARNLLDYHVILDLIPTISRLFFLRRLSISLSYTQAAILLALGLQHKSITHLEKEMDIQSNQVLALFNRSIRKISTFLRSLEEKSIEQTLALPSVQTQKQASSRLKPLKQSLNAELKEEEKKVQQEYKAKAADVLAHVNLDDYAIAGNDDQWNEALSRGSVPSTISIKNADKSSNPEYSKKHKRDADKANFAASMAERKAKKSKNKQG
eukprot:TRINITY_DN7925_c0_g3_i3.p1 TRINITY_DN7925_c0_g3~~TRINITY_DN7925_c0_g3_i3.p1  ORF type:complete len:1056 (+),score=346.16 TRINITY_DN7925_c0_g3_i3:76-3243(+)